MTVPLNLGNLGEYFNKSLKYNLNVDSSNIDILRVFSSHFSYFNDNSTVVSYKDRRIYQEDLFGLRTLDERGALHVFSVSGVKHHFWYRNATVIKEHILPWLN